jgi:hypothetical protein
MTPFEIARRRGYPFARLSEDTLIGGIWCQAFAEAPIPCQGEADTQDRLLVGLDKAQRPVILSVSLVE